MDRLTGMVLVHCCREIHLLFLQLCRELVCPEEEQRVKNLIILEKVRLEGVSGDYLVSLFLESKALD